MKIAISGSSGFIGTALIKALKEENHEVMRLVRSTPVDKNEIIWDPAKGVLEAENLEAKDAVVHLSGENIASWLWTKEQKRKILDSRVNSTKLLCETLAKLEKPPKTLISASAVGFYGEQGEETLTEEASVGSEFLAEVCDKWEKETRPAQEKGIRVVHLRIGLVLSTKGGALQKMLPFFKLGLGSVLGNGKQYMSWISLKDIIRAILFLLENEKISGPVNAVAPNPVNNYEYTKTLGKVLKRPTFLPAPAFALRLVAGEMADALFFTSTRAIPEKLLQNDYNFSHTKLEEALRDILNKT